MLKYFAEQKANQNSDELVMRAAKEMGRELYVHLSPEERRDKLDSMVSIMSFRTSHPTSGRFCVIMIIVILVMIIILIIMIMIIMIMMMIIIIMIIIIITIIIIIMIIMIMTIIMIILIMIIFI